MKKIFLILFVTTLAFCSKKGGKAPDGVYSQQEFANILKEIYLLENKIDEFGLSKDSARKIYFIYQDEMFQEKNIDSTLFQSSMRYYMNNLKELDDVYAILIDSLSLEERLLRGLNKEEEEEKKEERR